MRDLEFLPDWYPQLRHRKRLVRLQAYMTVLLVCGLAGFIYLVHRNIRTAAATSNELDRELIQSHREIGQLDEQVALKNQLLLQRKIDDRLGLPVEMCRMLATLDEKRPREMSLTDCQFDTQEQVRVVNSIGAARNAQKGDGIDRRMHVRLQGVAPTDNDIANFLGQLTNVSFFDQVAMSFSRDRTQDGHVMREFEITFTIDLNQQVSGGTTVATTGGGM